MKNLTAMLVKSITSNPEDWIAKTSTSFNYAGLVHRSGKMDITFSSNNNTLNYQQITVNIYTTNAVKQQCFYKDTAPPVYQAPAPLMYSKTIDTTTITDSTYIADIARVAGPIIIKEVRAQRRLFNKKVMAILE